MKPKATVAICTWNRAALLERTLQSMVNTLPKDDGSWELLVVNNRCTDDTDEVLAKFRDSLPLRRLFQPEQGKSHALNLAMDEAHGEWIFWTDDDVLLNLTAWLDEHLAAIKRHPEADFFGGPVVPFFDTPPPNWLVHGIQHIGPAFAAIDLGDQERPITHTKDSPFGANFVIRTETQRRYRYDVRLGRVGANEIRGEETAVVWRMLADGLHGVWAPSAPVLHVIPPQRMTLEYIRRFYLGIGRTTAIMSLVGVSKRSPVWRAWLRAITREIRYRMNRPWRSPAVWMHDMARASRRWGELELLREESRRRAA